MKGAESGNVSDKKEDGTNLSPDEKDGEKTANDYVYLLEPDDFVKALSFRKRIGKSTAQGRAYLYEFNYNGLKTHIVVKVSKHLDFFVRHEDEVMRDIVTLASWCPNYSWSYRSLSLRINTESYETEADPLEIKEGDKFIYQDVIVYMYVKGSVTLTSKLSLKNSMCFIQMITAAIVCGQNSIEFVHYDLHSDNILMRKCDPDIFCVYRFKNRSLIVPTAGYIPMIIDYGSVYTNSLTQRPVYGSMLATDAGYLTGIYDPVFDLQVFLSGTSTDLEQIDRLANNSFRRWVAGLFAPLNIDIENGWDINNDYCANGYVVQSIRECERAKPRSRYFTRHTDDCVSVLQSLTTYPCTDRGIGNIKKAYDTFITEFVKIENEIRSDLFRGYALMILTDVVREGLPLSVNFTDRMMRVTPFYAPPEGVDFDALRTSMLQMGSIIGTIYARMFADKIAEKTERYSLLPYKSAEDILFAMAKLYPVNIRLGSDSQIFVIDSVNKKRFPLRLSAEEIDAMEDYTQLEVSSYIHGIL